jgi:hypothetical protein
MPALCHFCRSPPLQRPRPAIFQTKKKRRQVAPLKEGVVQKIGLPVWSVEMYKCVTEASDNLQATGVQSI